MNPLRVISALASVCLALTSTWAQEQEPEHKLTARADMLQRGELRFGGNSTDSGEGGDMAAFIIARTRIAATYKWKDRIEGHFTAQHSGTWGQGSGTISVYEAWAQLNFGKGFFVKLGRQPISYDDQRIFGSDDWSMTGSTHDALKIGYEGFGHKVHVFGAFNQNPENIDGGTYFSGGIQPYKALQALWYHYDVPVFPLDVSLIAMNVVMQEVAAEKSENVWHQQLVGGALCFHPGKWEVKADYYRQLGHEEHGLPIQGWMASGKVGFAPSDALSFRAGYDYLSGDTDLVVPGQGLLGLTRHSVVKGFSSIYGSHHSFYGAMDFFYVSTYYGGFTPGLQNAYAGVSWNPVPRLNLDLSYHFLATAAKIKTADYPLGHELEFSAGYNFNKFVNLSMGYSFMYGTETMVVLKRTSDKRRLNWAWLMLRITPKFERSK